MAIKFSQFSESTTTSQVDFIVGYDGNQNVKITPSNFLAVLGDYLPLTGGTLTGNLTAPAFIKTGGTSSEFLKADGTVDTNTYLTTTTGDARYVELSGDTMTGDLTLDNSKLTINKTSDGVLLGDAAAKRMQWVNPNYITAHSEDPTSAGTYRKTFDFDGDYLGGGFVGVYESRTARPGVSMHAASYANASGHSLNQMKVYPPLTGGSTILLESKDLGTDATRFSGIEINDTRTPTGYPANRFRLNASFTDEATIPFYVNADAKINGDLTMGANSIFLGGTGAANEFDDYEEGTYNPEFYIGSYGTGYGSGDFTTWTNNSKYVKIGRQVTLFISLTYNGTPSAISSSNSSVYLGNIPFSLAYANVIGGTYQFGYLKSTVPSTYGYNSVLVPAFSTTTGLGGKIAFTKVTYNGGISLYVNYGMRGTDFPTTGAFGSNNTLGGVVTYYTND